MEGGVCGGGGGGCGGRGGERCPGANRQKTEDRRQPATAVAGEGKLGGVTQLPVTRPLLPRLLSLLPGQPPRWLSGASGLRAVAQHLRSCREQLQLHLFRLCNSPCSPPPNSPTSLHISTPSIHLQQPPLPCPPTPTSPLPSISSSNPP